MNTSRHFVVAAAFALAAPACSSGPADRVTTADPQAPLAVVQTRSLLWEGEQTYIPLYADGVAAGLIVVNLDGGQLYGTGTPDAWTWRHRDTVEICASVTILRNEAGFPPMTRDCAPHPISGKQLDEDADGTMDLIETFTVLDSAFFRDRPGD